MSQSDAPPRTGITIRLDPTTREQLQQVAAAEYRTVAGYVQMLIERELKAREDAERVIHVFVAPELANEPPGTLAREPGESDARFADRSAALRILLEGVKSPGK